VPWTREAWIRPTSIPGAELVLMSGLRHLTIFWDRISVRTERLPSRFKIWVDLAAVLFQNFLKKSVRMGGCQASPTNCQGSYLYRNHHPKTWQSDSFVSTILDPRFGPFRLCNESEQPSNGQILIGLSLLNDKDTPQIGFLWKICAESRRWWISDSELDIPSI